MSDNFPGADSPLDLGNVTKALRERLGGLKIIAVVVVAGLLALSSVYTVQPEEVGVILRLGKYAGTTEPGLRFKIPLIDRLEKVPVRRQLKEEFGFSSENVGVRSSFVSNPDEANMLTGDLNAAVVEWVVQYRVVDPYQYLYRVRNLDATFRDMSEAVMRKVVGDRTVNEVLTVGRAEIEGAVKVELQELCNQYETGIAIDQVVLQSNNPPEPVKPSFNAVNQAEQELERLVNEAEAEYNRVIPRAEGQALQTIQQAEGYALDRVNRAQGDATRFNALYEEFRQAPEVTRKRLFIETMERVLAEGGPEDRRRRGRRRSDADHELRGSQRREDVAAGRGPAGRGGNAVKVLTILLVLVLLLVASNALFIVPEDRQAIITQFGAPVGDAIDTPGLKFKLPFIQKAHYFDRRFLEWQGSAEELPTRDKVFIFVDTYARWRISDPLLFFQRLRDELGAQSRLDDILDGETRNAIANHDLIEVIRSSNREAAADESYPDAGGGLDEDGGGGLEEIVTGRDKIRQDILAAAQDRTADLGIEVLDVQFRRINYGQQVEPDVFNRMISERQRIADRFRSQGQGQASEILGNMDRDLKRIESEAYRQATEIRGRADAEATEIYASAYNQSVQSRNFYEFLRTMEAFEKTIDPNTWLVVSTDSDYFSFLKASGP